MKVYCRGCKHLLHTAVMDSIKMYMCLCLNIPLGYVCMNEKLFTEGAVDRTPRLCSEINANNDCEYFEKKEEEKEIIKKSWWDWLLGK